MTGAQPAPDDQGEPAGRLPRSLCGVATSWRGLARGSWPRTFHDAARTACSPHAVVGRRDARQEKPHEEWCSAQHWRPCSPTAGRSCASRAPRDRKSDLNRWTYDSQDGAGTAKIWVPRPGTISSGGPTVPRGMPGRSAMRSSGLRAMARTAGRRRFLGDRLRDHVGQRGVVQERRECRSRCPVRGRTLAVGGVGHEGQGPALTITTVGRGNGPTRGVRPGCRPHGGAAPPSGSARGCAGVAAGGPRQRRRAVVMGECGGVDGRGRRRAGSPRLWRPEVPSSDRPSGTTAKRSVGRGWRSRGVLAAVEAGPAKVERDAADCAAGFETT